jgi:hypothetical protein
MNGEAVKPRDRDAILQSLRSGVVPRRGQQHIQVGRAREIESLLTDIDRVADGGSALRFVIGDYGSGKTFFIFLVRSIALEKKLVSVHADLTPDRRLQAAGGQARALYSELVRNMATRARPDGGALPSVVERFVTSSLTESKETGTSAEVVIHSRMSELSEMVGGYDLAEVLAAYWRGYDSGDELLKSNAVRWLRGEFSTRTDARKALGVRNIVDDESFYDHLKLLARFVRLAGYGGLLVCLDEMVNLFKMHHTTSRNANYEQILRIVNDSLQGISVGLGFLFSGTPEFLMDARRGLYSYSALQSRLAQNAFAKDGLVDFSGPVLRLPNLSPEDLFVLLGKIRHIQAVGEKARYLLPDEGITAFMTHCSGRIGEAYFRTPRNSIVAFTNMLAILEQNPGTSWSNLLGQIEISEDKNPDLEPLDSMDASEGQTEHSKEPTPSSSSDDGLSSFKL